MTEELHQEKNHYTKNNELLEKLAENFCAKVQTFMHTDTFYKEARAERRQVTQKRLDQIKKDEVKIDEDIIQWQSKMELLFTKHDQIESIQNDIEKLHVQKKEIETELRALRETLQRLEKEKERVSAVPISDLNFLRLKKNLVSMRERQANDEKALSRTLSMNHKGPLSLH